MCLKHSPLNTCANRHTQLMLHAAYSRFVTLTNRSALTGSTAQAMSHTHSILRLTSRSASKYPALRTAWPTRYLGAYRSFGKIYTCFRLGVLLLSACGHVRTGHRSRTWEGCSLRMWASLGERGRWITYASCILLVEMISSKH